MFLFFLVALLSALGIVQKPAFAPKSILRHMTPGDMVITRLTFAAPDHTCEVRSTMNEKGEMVVDKVDWQGMPEATQASDTEPAGDDKAVKAYRKNVQMFNDPVFQAQASLGKKYSPRGDHPKLDTIAYRVVSGGNAARTVYEETVKVVDEDQEAS